jgi:hypothetical protein
MILKRPLFTVTAIFATVVAGLDSVTASPAAAARPTVDHVIRWNRTLLQIIRTPGAQPATVHPARNLAIMISVKYTAALQEVQWLGEVHRATRAADQTHVANFWAAPIQNYWNEIAHKATLDTTLAGNSPLFALLKLSFADKTIAFHDARDAYYIWLGDRGGDTAIPADPNWTPLAGSIAPDPSYPGAHSTVTAAAAVILQSVFGTDWFGYSVWSHTLPGVERSVSSSAGAKEASLGRIYAGQQIRPAQTSGIGRALMWRTAWFRDDLQLR